MSDQETSTSVVVFDTASDIEASVVMSLLDSHGIGAFRVSMVDKAPVMPVGVVTTQPDRSPPFRIARR